MLEQVSHYSRETKRTGTGVGLVGGGETESWAVAEGLFVPVCAVRASQPASKGG